MLDSFKLHYEELPEKARHRKGAKVATMRKPMREHRQRKKTQRRGGKRP